MIGICTDSNSQLPPQLAERYGVEVVPLTVVVDDREYLEGHDFNLDEFYALYSSGHPPDVQFAEPSSGQFALAYDDLAQRGCTQILSVHTAATSSATIKAARLAAHSAPVPVRLVDSGTARFGVSCCVWAAAEAIEAGAALDEAAVVAETLAPSIGNVFIAAGLHLDRDRTTDPAQPLRRVRSLVGDEVHTLCDVDSMVDVVNAMASYSLAWANRPGAGDHGGRLHVAVGHAHRDTLPIADAVAHAVGESAQVIDVVRFRVGPRVVCETGPGTVGCLMFPAASGSVQL